MLYKHISLQTSILFSSHHWLLSFVLSIFHMYLYKLPRTRFFLILFTYFLLSNFSTFHHLQSILHLVSWFRVILDEAHMIKDRSTSTAKAVFNLNSLNKWCLSGTPLQNRVGELYSLVRFLRIDPHAFYYCKRKDCGCKSLHYRSVSPKIKVSLSLSLSFLVRLFRSQSYPLGRPASLAVSVSLF